MSRQGGRTLAVEMRARIGHTVVIAGYSSDRISEAFLTLILAS